MNIQKCRIWWPKHLSSSEPPASCCLALFGWIVYSSSISVDVVIAFASDEASLSQYSQSAIEEAIYHANERMPITLQEKSSFSILGCCLPNAGSSVHSPDGKIRDGEQELYHDESHARDKCLSSGGICGCSKVDKLLQQHKQCQPAKFSWVQLYCDIDECFHGEICWIPKFQHMHWSDAVLFHTDLHIIFYDTPAFGVSHFSLSSSISNLDKQPACGPKWIKELYQKQQHTDLDTTIMAINSVAMADMFFNGHVDLKRSRCWFALVYMFHGFIWRVFAAVIASFATSLYVVLQSLHFLLKIGSKLPMYILLMKIFSNTAKIVHIRCCQFLYWPIFLNECGFRSRSCIQYAERAAVRKHFMWSCIAVDVLLGNLVGFTLLFHAEPTSKLVSNLAKHITDDILRSGCVWLMGVPAGFKLNTELARVLGLFSLNAIQIWSTLCSSGAQICYHSIKVVAFSGILFGMTVPAACFIDLVQVAALHVSTINWFVSLLYSYQIQALNALWRLFRGRKLNPLRHRLDSYDYSVEQHIVGSLLFSPVLLLLPTTSVFYMFFSMMDMTFKSLGGLVEMIISVIHATPYYEIFHRLGRSGRFPSGIWFDIIPCSKDVQLDNTANGKNPSFLISILQSNIMTFVDVVQPSYKKMCSGVHMSRIAKLVSGVVTGNILPKSLGFGLPSPMPWMHIPCKIYWRICYDSIVACIEPQW